MELRNTSQNIIDASELIHKIGKSSEDVNLLYSELIKDPDYLDGAVNRNVNESVFLRAINSLCLMRESAIILPALVDCVSDETITMPIFQALLDFPEHETRESVYVALCHKMLKAQQLEALCDIGDCFECFFSLAIERYCNTEYSEEQFEQSLSKFLESPYSEMSSVLLDELLYHCTQSSSKKEIAIKRLSP